MGKMHLTRSAAARLLGFAFFLLAAAFCLFWAGRLVAAGADERQDYLILNDEYSQILEADPEEGITQSFDWPAGSPLYGLRLDVAAFGRVNRGVAHLNLYDPAGNLAASAICDMTELLDNTFYGFVFEKAYCSQEDTGTEPLTFRFWYEPETGEDRLGLWASEGVPAGQKSARAGQTDLEATLAMQATSGYTGTLVSDAYRWLALGLAVMLGAGWLCVGRKVPVQRLFCLCGALLGLGFALVLPPLCGPDEYAHGASAYALASKLSGQPAYNEAGELYMRACDASYMTDETGPSGAFVYADWLRQLGQGGNSPQLTEAVSVRSAGSAAYLYLPSALGMLLGRTLGLSFYGVWLLGRLGSLAAYLALGTWALRRMPFGKNLLFTALVLPSTLGLAAGLSADTLTIGCSFALTALCLDCAFGRRQVRGGDLCGLVLLSALLGPGKAVYILLVGLVFLIPAECYSSPRRCVLVRCLTVGAAGLGWAFYNLEYIRYILRDVNEWAVWGGLVLLAVLAVLLPRLLRFWKALAPRYKRLSLAAALVLAVLAAAVGLYALRLGGDLTPQQLAEGIQPNGDSIYTYSVGYTLRHLPQVAELLVNSVIAQGFFWLQQLLGACPGEPIVHQLELNGLLTLALFCLVVLASLSAGEKRLPARAAWGAGGICLGVTALITAACLTWTPVNYQIIFGLQGRYLLPLLPLLMLLLGKNRWLTLTRPREGALQMEGLCLSTLALLNTLCLFAAL